MYQVTVKGRNLAELKSAVADINVELNAGRTPLGTTKDMSEVEVEETTPVVETQVEAPAPTPAVEDVNLDELDSEGCPWDERIHAKTRTQTAEGIWKKARGLDVDKYEKIKSELIATVKLLSNPTPIPPMPVNETTPVVEKQVEAPAPTPAPEPTPTPEPTPAMPQMTTGGHTLQSFSQNLPMVISGLITEGKVSAEYIEQLKSYFGVSEIWDVNETQKAEMFEAFSGAGFIQKV